MKIRTVETEQFHAPGQTDITKQIVAFRNFANAPKNVIRMVQHSPGVSTRRTSWRLSRSSKDNTENLTREWHVFSHTKSQHVQHL
jgi:hypothetical protein